MQPFRQKAGSPATAHHSARPDGRRYARLAEPASQREQYRAVMRTGPTQMQLRQKLLQLGGLNERVDAGAPTAFG